MKSLITIFLVCLAASADGQPLVVEPKMISLSAVKDKTSLPASIRVHNTGDSPLPLVTHLRGKDADAFLIQAGPTTLPTNQTIDLHVNLTPIRGFGFYEAELQIGDSSIPLKGIGLNAFEGKNEPPLDMIVRAFGIPLKVGGTALHLDVKADAIGDGLAIRRFKGIVGTRAKVTPIARFSPPGETPFGWLVKEGDLQPLGHLADSKQRPDCHQCLLPSLKENTRSISFDAPAEPFAFYMKGHQYTAFTDPSLPTKATIPHTIRIYPVTRFLGKALRHAYLICCEEASNGDYQDAVFLMENVTHE